MTSNAEINEKMAGRTISSSFLETVRDHGDLVALRWKDADDAWHELTFTEFADRIARAAASKTEIN